VFVAASTRCFADLPVPEAVSLITDLEYTKYELWFGDDFEATRPAHAAAHPEEFASALRDASRITPIAITLADDVDTATFTGIAQLAKALRVAQLTIPASPVGTPFNTEIDRLRNFVRIGSENGLRLSIKTRTGDLSQDPHTAVELCQSVKGLGITLDPSYFVCGPHAGQPYDQVFPYVYHMHLRDTTPETLQVPTGLGEIDYSRLVAQARKQDYTGSLSVELYHDQMDLDTRPLEMRKLRRLLETLE
jgi:sugar phosphate isomerase/epimerase